MQGPKRTPDYTYAISGEQKWHTQEHTAPRTLAEELSLGSTSSQLRQILRCPRTPQEEKSGIK